MYRTGQDGCWGAAWIFALDMEPEDRKGRMRALRTTLRHYDIKAWAKEQHRLFEAAGDHGPGKGDVLSAA